VVRHDPRDAPYVYNIDHYRVLENLQLHPEYEKVITLAHVEDSEELREALSKNVFVVGPYRLADHHWVTEIPAQIANAKSK
jgi:hypothetical protein